MRTRENLAPIHSVYGIVLRVSRMEEPQHALEAPGWIRRGRELAPIFLVPGRPTPVMNREPRGYADGVGVRFKRAHARGEAFRLQPIIMADPAEERTS